jgi:hypothetical protein
MQQAAALIISKSHHFAGVTCEKTGSFCRNPHDYIISISYSIPISHHLKQPSTLEIVSLEAWRIDDENCFCFFPAAHAASTGKHLEAS